MEHDVTLLIDLHSGKYSYLFILNMFFMLTSKRFVSAIFMYINAYFSMSHFSFRIQ